MLRCLAFTLSLAVAPCAAQTLHVVAFDGSGDFTSVQAAVDASSSGDVVVLEGGAFIEHVEIVGKGLSLVGLGGTGIVAPGGVLGEPRPTLLVRDVPPDARVVLAGMQLFSANGNAPATLSVEDCAGPVWLDDMFLDSYGSPAVVVDDCASFVAVDSLLQTNVVAPGPVGGEGARFVDASAHLHEATLRGSHGPFVLAGMPPPTGPMTGGSGASLRRSSLRAAGSQLAGGSGSAFLDAGCLVGASGGHGLLVHASEAGEPASSARLVDTAVDASGSSSFDAGCAPVPAVASDVLAPPGTVTTDATPARRLDVDAVASAGGTLSITVDAEPGDLAWLFTSAAATPGVPAGGVTLHLEPASLTSLFVLSTGATGDLAFDVGVPALPLGVEVLAVPLQTVFVDAGGARHDGGPSHVVIR